MPPLAFAGGHRESTWQPGLADLLVLHSLGTGKSVGTRRDKILLSKSACTALEPQALLPVLREMGEPRGHLRQDALALRLALVAAAPWRRLELQRQQQLRAASVSPVKGRARPTFVVCGQIHVNQPLAAPFKRALSWL